MTATLKLSFEDGSSKEIELKKVLLIDTPLSARQELSFRESASGWVMAVTHGLLDGKKLSSNFCTVTKNA